MVRREQENTEEIEAVLTWQSRSPLIPCPPPQILCSFCTLPWSLFYLFSAYLLLAPPSPLQLSNANNSFARSPSLSPYLWPSSSTVEYALKVLTASNAASHIGLAAINGPITSLLVSEEQTLERQHSRGSFWPLDTERHDVCGNHPGTMNRAWLKCMGHIQNRRQKLSLQVHFCTWFRHRWIAQLKCVYIYSFCLSLITQKPVTIANELFFVVVSFSQQSLSCSLLW